MAELIRDEKERYDKIEMLFKTREKSLNDRTRKLVQLEEQKRALRDTGKESEVSSVKKKQRALLLKLQQEKEEMNRSAVAIYSNLYTHVYVTPFKKKKKTFLRLQIEGTAQNCEPRAKIDVAETTQHVQSTNVDEKYIDKAQEESSGQSIAEAIVGADEGLRHTQQQLDEFSGRLGQVAVGS